MESKIIGPMIEMKYFCRKCGEYQRALEKELAEARAELEKYKMGKVSPADYYSMAEAEEKLCKELAEARAGVEHWKGECRDLVRKAHEMRAEIDYFQTLIDLQHKRTVEADKLWQAAHNKPDVWPDLGVLIEWLLLRLKNQETIIEANRAAIERLLARNKIMDASITDMVDEQAALCAEDQSITELVAAKDKLIEQIREALLLFAEGAIHDFHYVCQHRDNCLCLACQKARVKAALAAERGE